MDLKVHLNLKVCLIWLGFLLTACNGDHVPDCLQNTGKLVREELEVDAFDRVTVYEKVGVVIRYGAEQKVELETGEYLRSEVRATVSNGRLQLYNTNGCNLFREYGTTTFYITVPDLKEIRSSTGLPIVSDGVLPFNNLTLYSESYSDPGAETKDGSFDLELDVQDLSVVTNGIAFFRLRGTAVQSNFTIGAGDSRIEAEQLISQSVMINHRGSNDILVNPRENLQGVIRGTGDVVSFFRPVNVDVDILYKGRLLFRD